MPTYEYICEACEHAWEEEQRMVDPALTTCPECKKESAKRQISKSSFVLAGGGVGWFKEGYSK